MTDRIVRVVLRGDIVGLKAAMSEGSAVVSATAGKMTAATKEAEKFRGGLTSLGSQAGKVGLVAGAGLAYAVKSAADFNAEMALVRTLSHAGATDMAALSHAALTVGQNIGYTAKSVAQGEEELVKAGVSVKDILGGGLKGALDLAAAGQTDVATATSIAASAMTEFQLKGKDIPHLADELAAGADKALGSVEDLGLGLTQSGTTAHQMGLSLEQTVGTLTAFAQAGLIGERGGTTFKQMLLQLAAPTKQAQTLMDRYGISLYNANGQIKTMPELAGNLQSALAGIDPKARNAALGIIFGSRAIQGANILMANGSKGIQDWISKTNDQGFAAQQASGKLDSLAGDWKKLQAAFQTAAIGTGSGSQSPLRVLTQDATSALNAFNKMPGPLKGLTSNMLAITAITGGGLWFGSRVVKNVASTRAAMSDLNVTLRDSEGNLTRTGVAFRRLSIGAGVLVGLAALDGAMSSIDHHNIGPTVNELTNALDNLASGKITTLGKNFGNLGDELTLIDSKSSGAVAGVENLLSPLTKLSESISGGLGFSDRGISTRIDDATTSIQTLDEALAGMVTSGSVDQAKTALLELEQSQGLSVDQQKKLLQQLPQYRDALAGVKTSATGAATATGALATASEAADKALAASRKAASQTAHQFFGLGKDVSNTKVSLDSWIKDLDKQAAALRDFTKNAQTAGKRGLRDGLVAELEKAGPEGALRMKQLADGTDAQIKRANKAWANGQRAIDQYVNVVGGVPTSVTTSLRADTRQAMSAVTALARLMADLHDRNIHVTVTKSTNATIAEASASSGKHKTGADGATVPQTGRGYADRHHYLLADGEEVVSDRHGGATKNRPALKAASRGATIAVVGMANGGTAGGPAAGPSYAAGAGITVYFPTPAQLGAAVNAADKIAADAVKVARSADDIRQQGLDDLHTQQQIRDLQHSLHARNKKGRLELRGLDREAAKAELADAKAQLVEIRNQAKKARDEARQQAIDDLIQKRADTAATLSKTGDIFANGTGPTSAISSVNRQIADISQYGQVVAQLKAAGASPALLAQMVAKAESGDFRSAIRLGQALLAQPALLGQLNRALGTLGTTAGAVATLTTDPRFLSAGAWNPTSTVAKVVQVNLTADPTTWMTELKRVVTFEIEAAMTKATR